MNIVRDWIHRVLIDPEAVVLLLLLLLGLGIIIFMGRMLAPVFAGLVIAFLLEGLVRYLERAQLPRRYAVAIVFILFNAFLVFMVIGLLPMLSRQLTQLAQELPNMLLKGQELLLNLPHKYPAFISEQQVTNMIASIKAELGTLAQYLLSWSLASVVSLITLAIYLFLVPLLVFFFLKDKQRLLAWFQGFLPRDYALAKQVWHEVDLQMGNYVRGKFWEVVIVWSSSFVTFSLLNLQFAMLLGLMVGLSVIIPYIGAAVVTIPVALVALFQWGWGENFVWLIAAYAVVQAIDGNILVPLLFSEVVNLHPIAIIVAVLVFGGVWGFWGVFFAIPLATVVQAVIKAWPRPPRSNAPARPQTAGVRKTG